MGFNCGIVGLPNVGKSTLFNALTATAAAEAANFPFTTIEPNVGRVAVPDDRLNTLVEMVNPAKTTPTQLEFVDIAGLVRGASKGEGLGNQFLGNIREVDAILHVLRCFEDDNVIHVEGGIDPLRDAETIETELMLADLESLEKRVTPLTKKIRGGDKEAKETLALVELASAALQEGKPARSVMPTDDRVHLFRQLQLLTAKPMFFVCNVEEDAAATGNGLSETVTAWSREQGSDAIVVSAKIESEVDALEDAAEKAEFLESLGLSEPGLHQLIRSGYRLLDLITFFTVGPTEVRAWTIPGGTQAAQAGGTIHTDFERGFIAAATIAYDDFIACGGEQEAKDAGKMRLEGRDYVVQDGDIILFRFNV